MSGRQAREGCRALAAAEAGLRVADNERMTSSGTVCTHASNPARYVLGELRGRELDAFVRHLRGCELCAEEVELLEAAAGTTPLLGTRHTELDSANVPDAQRRIPLRAIDGGAPGGDAGDAAKAEANAAAAREAAAIREATASAAATRSEPSWRVLKQPIPKPAMFAFAALAVFAALTVSLSRRTGHVSYVRVKAGWTPGGAALKLQGNQLGLLVDEMPRPRDGSGYQVWVLDGLTHRLTPTGTWLRLNRRGQAGVDVPGDYHDWDAVAVYVEPLHGRDTTASGAVVVADLRDRH